MSATTLVYLLILIPSIVSFWKVSVHINMLLTTTSSLTLKICL